VDPEWAPCGKCFCVDGEVRYDRWFLKGVEFNPRQCPRRLRTQESVDWLQLFSSYKAGFLLMAGGLMDQPAIYLNTMTLIEGLVAKAREK
jgi:hypothetical protein